MPLRPERVVEVRYDHMEGERFRHTAQFNRWRPDRDPRSCTYAQLEQPVTFSLGDIVPGLYSKLTSLKSIATISWSGIALPSASAR